MSADNRPNADCAGRMSEQYAEKVGGVAAALRDLASRVEQVGRVREVHIGPKFSHAVAAERVIHEVTWGVANLSLGVLLDFALYADEAVHIEKSEDSGNGHTEGIDH